MPRTYVVKRHSHDSPNPLAKIRIYIVYFADRSGSYLVHGIDIRFTYLWDKVPVPLSLRPTRITQKKPRNLVIKLNLRALNLCYSLNFLGRCTLVLYDVFNIINSNINGTFVERSNDFFPVDTSLQVSMYFSV